MALAYDNSAFITTTTGTSISGSYTTGSIVNGILIAMVWGTTGGTDTTTGMTYNGVAMTKLAFAPSGSGGHGTSVWYLVNPPSGSHTLAASFSGSTQCALGAITYGGASQTGIPDSSSTQGSGSNPSPMRATTTPVATGCTSFGFFYCNPNSAAANGNPGTIRVNNTTNGLYIVTVDNANPGSQDVGMDMFNTGWQWSGVGVSIAPSLPVQHGAFLLNLL